MSTTTKTKKRTNKHACATLDWTFVEKILSSDVVRTVYLWGPPGIGKTYCAYHKGRIGDGVFAITLTEDTPAAELRGHYLPVGKEMVWRDGPFTTAMRKGARLVVNEISHGTPEALALLYPVLESVETARLTLPTNETVRPAPGFHVIVTDNEPLDNLPAALQDRFDSVLKIDSPHPEALAKLTTPLRRAAERTFSLEQERRVSLRGWLTLQRLVENGFALAEACVSVFGPERGSHVHDAIVLGEPNN